MVGIPALLQAARGISPCGIGWGASGVAAPQPALWEGEELAKAVPARLSEFASGRACARAAMAQLGVPQAAVPHGPDRAPIWPTGLSGSISHSTVACLAAVTHAPRLIGIDLELATSLVSSLWDTVLMAPEQAAVKTMPNPALAAKLVFSAKEAVYKAQYPHSKTMLGFDSVEITLGDGSFAARFTQGIKGFAKDTVLQGRFCQSEGHYLTLIVA